MEVEYHDNELSDYNNILVIQKNYEERLEEYMNILSPDQAIGKVMSASQIRTEWSFDVELVIEPVGWQALWNITRSTCEQYEIPYPMIVLVEVLAIDFTALTALVKIIAVLVDLQLPDKYDVPLNDLYVTSKQKNPALDIERTANCVDRLRFFYNYLWMPWDEDEDEDVDWVQQHLQTRLKLHFDMKENKISKEMCDTIKSLISEGRKIREKISQLECNLSDLEEDMKEMEDRDEDDTFKKETYTLLQLHFRLQQIKAEMDLMENPMMRTFLNKSQLEKIKNNDNADQNDTKHYFVWENGTVQEFQNISNKIQTMLPKDTNIKLHGCLQKVLNTYKVDGTILLGKGEYRIKYTNRLDKKVAIVGIYNAENTVLLSKDVNTLSTLLNIFSEITLKNVCIELEALQAGMIVQKNCAVTMTDCRIRVSVNPSSVKCGIMVMPGAKLVANNTVFQALGTAMITCATSEIVLNECSFEECYEGIRFSDNVRLTATNCAFKNMKSYAVVMESELNSGIITGSEELFANISEVSLNKCKFDNEKCVLLKRRQFT